MILEAFKIASSCSFQLFEWATTPLGSLISGTGTVDLIYTATSGDDTAEIITDVLAFVKRRTASRLSDLTHQLEVWKSSNTGEIITFDQLNNFSLSNWK